jgi:5-methyltetrahydropteroyltriglutamate--homocysteine methyltransferase
METIVDDVGSFPLPPHVRREQFERAYIQARQAINLGKDPQKDGFLSKNFCQVVLDSFRKKRLAGLDVVTYPQHYDMYKQFLDVINAIMDKGTYVVTSEQAFIPEIRVIEAEAKRLHEETGKKIRLRVCITGPMELYLKAVGTTCYKDVLLMFSETVRRFAKNSVLNSKYVKTEAVSLDEPSFGFQEVSTDRDVIIETLEKAYAFSGVIKQVHLHSTARITHVLDVKNLDVASFEFGASPKNIVGLSKKMFDKADKQVRVGITRTDIDSITAELRGKGVSKPTIEQLVENEYTIRRRYAFVKAMFGDRLAFTGPDCGLGGWPTQESAQLLLERTVRAVKGR